MASLCRRPEDALEVGCDVSYLIHGEDGVSAESLAIESTAKSYHSRDRPVDGNICMHGR